MTTHSVKLNQIISSCFVHDLSTGELAVLVDSGPNGPPQDYIIMRGDTEVVVLDDQYVYKVDEINWVVRRLMRGEVVTITGR